MVSNRVLTIVSIILFSFSIKNFAFGNTRITNNSESDNSEYSIYKDFIYKENIKSVLLYRKGWELSYPIMELGSNTGLELRFDDLNEDTEDYWYTFIHCNTDWTKSNLSTHEYIDNFTESQIVDYDYSRNTKIPYIHYWVEFPNEDMQITKSGNYILKVFKDGNPDDIVLTKRFYVFENLSQIKAKVKRPSLPQYMNTGQEVDFNITYTGIPVNAPMHEIKAFVMQNHQEDSKKSLKPLFFRNNELIYDYSDKNVFEGSNEYQHVDIKTIRYQELQIARIEYIEDYFHVFLKDDPLRSNKRYFYDEDLDGNFLIDIQESDDNHTEADYVKVRFSVPLEAPLPNQSLHVVGRFNDYKIDDSNKMRYVYTDKKYELNLMMKQGYYNYKYALYDPKKNTIDYSFVEGDFYETENEYQIFVYFRGMNAYYDRLIGYLSINSLTSKSNEVGF